MPLSFGIHWTYYYCIKGHNSFLSQIAITDYLTITGSNSVQVFYLNRCSAFRRRWRAILLVSTSPVSPLVSAPKFLSCEFLLVNATMLPWVPSACFHPFSYYVINQVIRFLIILPHLHYPLSFLLSRHKSWQASDFFFESFPDFH